MRGGSHFLCCCKESNQRKQLLGQRREDVTTFDSFSVARPWECPPLSVGRIGTRTHRGIAPLNEVARQSFIRLGTACRRKAHMVVKQAWRYDEASLGMRGRRMKRLVAAHRTSEQSADGCMTALPLACRVRCGSGSAYRSARRTKADTPAVGPLWTNQGEDLLTPLAR